MDLMDLIGASGGLGQIAQQVGLTPEDAQRGAQAVLPDIVTKLQESALGGGLGGLLGLAGAAQGGANAGQLVTQLLGSEDALRGLVAKAAQLTGIPASTLEKFIPLLTSLVTSTVAKQGNLGDALSGMLSGGLGSLLGGGGQGQKAENPLADVASLAGKLFG
jgi:hypothetical protein